MFLSVFFLLLSFKRKIIGIIFSGFDPIMSIVVPIAAVVGMLIIAAFIGVIVWKKRAKSTTK